MMKVEFLSFSCTDSSPNHGPRRQPDTSPTESQPVSSSVAAIRSTTATSTDHVVVNGHVSTESTPELFSNSTSDESDRASTPELVIDNSAELDTDGKPLYIL